jgi:pyrroloquinoline quinone (PQQ) biosynthesis protein C
MSSVERLLEVDTSPSVFVDSLQEYALSSRAANHPLLERIATGNLPDVVANITFLLSEYYHYSHQFTRYLTAVMANLEAPKSRSALVRNAADESGYIAPDEAAELLRNGIDPEHAKAPHPELFRRFLRAIGAKPEEILRGKPYVATLAWVEAFRGLCMHGGEIQGVGALGIGTEGIVAVMYRRILRGIAIAWPNMSARDRVFFELHAVVDDDHAHTLREIALAFAEEPEGRRELAVGVYRALVMRAAFFDEMMAEIDAMATTTTRIVVNIGPQGALA